MRVAVDARELQGRPTGVGRFLDEVLAAWRRRPDTAPGEIVLCAPDAGAPGGTAWEQFTLPRLVREAGADVLFAPAYTAPLRVQVPTVLVIHDVSFCAHPEWFSWREGARRRTLTRLAAARAARVLTVSEFSRREIAAYLDVPLDRIDVVHHGVSRMTEARARPAAGGSILFVGSIFTRRHIPELIDGFARVARAHAGVQLDLVGDNRTSPRVDLPEIARASGVGDRIHIRAYVAEEELRRLYDRASAFVFLSDYEGFGLTPLEALGAGLPIVVLDTPVGREVYGDAAFFVPRPQPALIQEALQRVLFDPETRDRLRAAAPAILARYSWDDAACRVSRALAAAATQGARR